MLKVTKPDGVEFVKTDGTDGWKSRVNFKEKNATRMSTAISYLK
jgi:hypothetical protein